MDAAGSLRFKDRRHAVDHIHMTYDRALKRLYVFGARIHHGAVGLALSAIGVALVIHDRADWPFRFRD
jgi:hypothetical protein